MQLKKITNFLENFAPLQLQESYDNAGLLVGNPDMKITSILISVDITEDVILEAIDKKCNLIVAHHPIIFGGIKKLTGKNYIERTVIAAIKNNIALYAGHTNVDSIIGGVNSKICEKIGLKNCKILSPQKNGLKKIVTFVPNDYLNKVSEALFNAGAGHIGNYDSCSYKVGGEGTFRALENANPFVGDIGNLHTEKETRIETIFPAHLQSRVVSKLIKAHPYEEVAYDIYSLDNENSDIGIGMLGELEEEMDEKEFLLKIKEIFELGVIKHTPFLNKKIKKVAVCGGSGAFLLEKAKRSHADIFITSDFKYHQFFDAEKKILIADIGHYESEQFTKEIFYEQLTKFLPNFAIYLSKINTNPVNYL